MSRLKPCFEALKAEDRAAFVTYVQAGDPNREISTEIFKGLPAAGADIIELGMPFSDPAADGPAIDRAAQRSLAAGASMKQTLQMVREFREENDSTPIVLMGYFNPVYAYGVERFCSDAAEAGVDGLIVVDLPPEEDDELRIPANAKGIDIIRLATPTSDDERLPAVLNGASGFVYYVAVAGVTGGKSATADDIGTAVQRIKSHTGLPVAVGFGIRTPEQAAAVAARADAAVVGSAIVDLIEAGINDDGTIRDGVVQEVLDFTRELADGVKSGR
ncbi:tryptophan synthase subunit alpha [Kordiimonas laminariae]|uniref:tryptophan synthase subunit alpha n=1 Tax=Kordiimonas laminariae TaxID=2917717 RepID=UPI001FF31B84|nr:tryptophan synthase subunit alpha [Kordiimonas laminariae]MCK0069241.1 tryptophan synthase subunit alpha [Kordiimonas laminariae]